MKSFTVEQIIKATNGELISGSSKAEVYGISTDSRTVKKGDLFFPLIGENFDAHDFLDQVFDAGCETVVVSNKEKLSAKAEGKNVVLVADTTLALQDLASYYLDSMPLKKRICITGSVGKTSTRDMTYYVMRTTFKADRNKKNYNNGIGLPKSILEFDPDTEVAVLEIGMSEQGSTHELSRFTKPNMALFTNIGISHVGKFPKEGRMGLLNAKLGVMDYFDESSRMIINADNDLLGSDDIRNRFNPVRVGTTDDCDYIVKDVIDHGEDGVTYTLVRSGKEYVIDLPVPGAHNAMNATLAIAAGELMGISIETAITGLKEAELTEKRLNIVNNARGVKVIDDTYNAAPQSMQAGMNTLMATEGKGRHIAILGDMFELGTETESGHKCVGEYAAKKGVDLLLAVGENSRFMIDGWVEVKGSLGHNVTKVMDTPLIMRDTDDNTQAEYFKDKEMVISHINEHLFNGDTVLVKASNAMRMDLIVKEILK